MLLVVVVAAILPVAIVAASVAGSINHATICSVDETIAVAGDAR